MGGRVCRDSEVLGEMFPVEEDQVSERGCRELGWVVGRAQAARVVRRVWEGSWLGAASTSTPANEGGGRSSSSWMRLS